MEYTVLAPEGHIAFRQLVKVTDNYIDAFRYAWRKWQANSTSIVYASMEKKGIPPVILEYQGVTHDYSGRHPAIWCTWNKHIRIDCSSLAGRIENHALLMAERLDRWSEKSWFAARLIPAYISFLAIPYWICRGVFGK